MMQRVGEGVHADDAALHRAREGADVLLALEHLGITLVEALRDGGVLADAALRQAAVHAVPAGQHLARAFEQHLAVRGKEAFVLRRLQDADYADIGLAAPVGAGTVAAVMADVHRLIALGRRRVVYREKLIGIQIVARTGVFFLQGAHGDFRAPGLRESSCRTEREQGCKDKDRFLHFHRFVCYFITDKYSQFLIRGFCRFCKSNTRACKCIKCQVRPSGHAGGRRPAGVSCC